MIDDAVRSAVLSVLRGEESEEAVCRRLDIGGDAYRTAETQLLKSRLSDVNAHLSVPGLSATARIERDHWGVAHCAADTEEDLYFAVGVAQAQDRLWQLDYRRRLASGTLAEILGQPCLRSDLENRTLGFRRIVEEVELPEMAPEAAAVLDSYAAGVNAWIDSIGDSLPIEFDILEYRPHPWTPVDSLAILRHFWWTLTGRLTQLVAAERLLRATPPDVAEWFLRPETVSYIVPGAGEQADGRLAGSGDDDMPGSNSWVAGASRLTEGGPVLAADPHWPLTFPDMWYEQHVCCPGIDCIGAAYPGAPPVIFGRTRDVAWGRTNNVTSTRDLYHERLNPDDPGQYGEGLHWEDFRTIDEQVAVRGAETVSHEVLLSCRGPVVNEWIPPVAKSGDGPITLRWTGQEHIGDVQVLLDLSRVRSLSETIDVFTRWRLSVWNSVVADSDGNLAYHMCGSVPRRGVLTRGTRPADEPGHDWEGYLNTPDLPGEVNPSRGWVATANNPPIEAQAGQELMYGTYADAYRVDRITRFLESVDKHLPEAVADLQADNLSLRAEQLKGAVADLLAHADDEALRRIAAELQEWNARYDLEQTGAAVWEALWPRLVKRVGEAALDPFVAELNASNAGRVTRHLLLQEGELSFFDGDLTALVHTATAEAMQYLVSALGPDTASWTWARAHTMHFRHPLATNPAAERVFNPPPIPCPGGSTMVNNRSSREGACGFETTGGPSYRLVADLSGIDALGCLLAGQSAQPGSPHYSDQAALWPRGLMHPLIMDRQGLDRECQSVTVLDPES